MHYICRGGDEVNEIGLRKEIAKLGVFENDQAAPPPIRGSQNGSMLSESISGRTLRFEKPVADPTKKKLMTLLGIPPGLEEVVKRELLKSASFGESVLDEKADGESSKPKFLSGKKKMPLDEYFETLNIEIIENKELVRKVYMAIGGLITPEQLFPGKVKANKATNFMDDEEIQNKLNEIEGDQTEQEQQAPVKKKGLEYDITKRLMCELIILQ